jgi:hypothetical protein
LRKTAAKDQVVWSFIILLAKVTHWILDYVLAVEVCFAVNMLLHKKPDEE